MSFFQKTTTILIYFILCLAFIFCGKTLNDSNYEFRCGSNDFNPTPFYPQTIAPLKEDNKKYKRLLDSDGFKDFNIYLDLNNFNEEVKKYKLNDKRDIFVSGMQKAIKTLQSLLRVKQVQNFVFPDELLIKYQIYKWDETKCGSKAAGMQQLGIDLFIFVRFESFPKGSNVLASAGPIAFSPGTGQPLAGMVNINLNANYSIGNSMKYFEGIILHEFTHILGFNSGHFTNYFHNYIIKEDCYGIKSAFINSTRVLKVARKYFNCNSLDGVQLENSGGDGTFGSHWEARILLGEYMNGVIHTPEQVISEFTLAVLEDSGYYKANYYTGGLMQFGKNKGCEFLNSKCINNGNINSKFSNEFFDNINSDFSNLDSSCTAGRQSRAYHFLQNYKDDLPEKFGYFSNKKVGGPNYTEYCPISNNLYLEQEKNYYVGHCSEKGGDNYGAYIPYLSGTKLIFHESGKISSITGETHSSNSFCALSTLISKNENNYSYLSKTLRAVCYKMFCSDRSLTIQIKNNFMVCPRAGGKITSSYFDGYLLCPDYNLICSGTVLCNDMFDCVEKKSSLREDIKYDYVSRTSQDYVDIFNEKIEEDGYELSNNGKCPLNCQQCNEKGECLICKDRTFINAKKQCEICPNDYIYIKGGSACYKRCNAGQYPFGDKCYTCKAGTYSTAGSSQCTSCKPGFYSNSGSSQCMKCRAGTFSLAGSYTCNKCSAGKYSYEGASSCLNCPTGSYSTEGSSSCRKCSAGQYLKSGKCYKCNAGTYSSKSGATGCTQCQAGTYSSKGETSCHKCPAGKYSKKGSSSCTKCKAGTYSSKGSSSCKLCPAGYYSTEGDSSCTKCKAGTYSSSKGSKSCKKCPKGKSSKAGSSSCK